VAGFQSKLNKLSSFATPMVAVGAAMATGGLALHQFIESIERLDDIGDAAERLNMSAVSLYRLKHAAELSDASFDSLVKGLEKYIDNVGEASMGNAEMQRTFSRLGLSAQDLAGKGVTGGFLQTAEALSRVQNSYQRAALAKNIFGKGVSELMPFINQGADGIRKLGQEVNITAEAFQRAGEADKNVKRLSATWTQFKDNLSTSVVPVLNKVLEQINKMEGGKGPFWQYKTKPDEAEAPLGKALEMAALEKLEKWHEKLTKDVADFEAELRKQIATEGMSADQAKLWELAQRGASYANEQRVAGLIQQREEQKRLAEVEKQRLSRLQEEAQLAQRIFDDTRTPLEKFQQELANLQLTEMSLDPELVKRQTARLAEDLIAAAGEPGSRRLPEGMVRGSAEAVSAANQFSAQSRERNDIASRFERAVKILEIKQEQTRRNGDDIFKVLRERLPSMKTQTIPE